MKRVNNNDVEKLQMDLGRMGEWAVENGMKINPGKSKVVSFTRGRVKDPLNYSLLDQVIPEASSCKYLGIILHSDLSSTDHVNYKAKKTWKALHFTMRILKQGNSNTKSISYCTVIFNSKNYQFFSFLCENYFLTSKLLNTLSLIPYTVFFSVIPVVLPVSI